MHQLFANNLEACILLFLGGASFGILTVLILSLNGIVIGAITEIISHGHSAIFIAAAILPHGIFEIPAFILAAALGFLMAQSLIAEWYGAADTAADATSPPGSSSSAWCPLSPWRQWSRLLLHRQSYI